MNALSFERYLRGNIRIKWFIGKDNLEFLELENKGSQFREGKIANKFVLNKKKQIQNDFSPPLYSIILV